MTTRLETIELSDSLEWPDEFLWSPVSQQVEVSSGGSLIVEESQQLAGRPITLQSGNSGSTFWGLATHATVVALRALADAARTDPMELELEDGRTFDVRWRHGANAFEARPVKHIVPAEAEDLYMITLRLFEV